jgi:hypothetical protein
VWGPRVWGLASGGDREGAPTDEPGPGFGAEIEATDERAPEPSSGGGASMLPAGYESCDDNPLLAGCDVAVPEGPVPRGTVSCRPPDALL